jgi:hypothetical protein
VNAMWLSVIVALHHSWNAGTVVDIGSDFSAS